MLEIAEKYGQWPADMLRRTGPDDWLWYLRARRWERAKIQRQNAEVKKAKRGAK